VRSLLDQHGIRLTRRDERTVGSAIAVTFQGELRPEQSDAVEKVLRHDEGIICAPTAFGNTVVGAAPIAARKVNVLVLVDRQQLLDQWRERLAAFLDLPIKSIGQIGGGKTARTGVIDVAVIQSLQRKGEVKDFVAEYGQVIVDECHHISAFTFEQILRQVKARVRRRPHGDADQKRRPSTYRPHAVRADSLWHKCTGGRREVPVPAFAGAEAHGFPNGARGGRVNHS
jgi:superfamily II DNA or RNA helicase